MYLPCEHDPFEAIDRRWRRANHLASQRRSRWHPSDDPWVRDGVGYVRGLRRCRTDRQRRRLAERMPVMHLAHAIHGSDPPHLRWAVEARLLAGEDFAGIAQKCATTPEAVEAYEKLFFNVMDKLEASTWVVCQAIGSKAHVGMTEHDLDVLWKLFGYAHGPLALDALIEHRTGRPRPETPEQVGPLLGKDSHSLLLRKLAVAAFLLPVTPETALTILEVLMPLVDRLDRSPVSAGPVTPDLQALILGLESLTQGDGQPTRGTSNPVRPARVEREPDPGELLVTAAGVDGSSSEHEQDLVVPEPIRRRSLALHTTPELVTG